MPTRIESKTMNRSIKTQTPAAFSSGWVKVFDLLWHHHYIDALELLWLVGPARKW